MSLLLPLLLMLLPVQAPTVAQQGPRQALPLTLAQQVRERVHVVLGQLAPACWKHLSVECFVL